MWIRSQGGLRLHNVNRIEIEHFENKEIATVNIEAEEIKIFRNPQLAVGIDIGNANTCVTIYKEGE